MLRKIRIILAIGVITCLTCIFLGVTWLFIIKFAWLAKIQFLPAIMALNIGVLVGLALPTLIFGRIYCSVICPLGIMQDGFSWLGRKFKKNRYFYSSEKRWLRYGVLAAFVLCLIVGFTPATTVLAPYSAYGRIVNSLFRPLYDMLQNVLVMVDEHYNTYHFSSVEIWMRSVSTFCVALLTLLILAVIAWKNGRTYCNTICPVGTTLSFLARFSLLRVQFDKTKCKNCSMCEKNCKASAIDYKNGVVDYARCVVCGDCTDKCKFDALHYTLYTGKKKGAVANADNSQPHDASIDDGRRAFLVGLAGATSAAVMAETKVKVDGGLAVIEKKEAPIRQMPIVPPGAGSIANFSKHCTACQLCVSACPNDVLRPSTDPSRFMQPEMSYERGWCRPECTRCSQVCPTGAIKFLEGGAKTSVHVGHAVWIKSNCIPVSVGDSCGSCAKHCPSHAIFMVDLPLEDGRVVKVPSIDAARCMGCGACEYLCPARPFSAIYVEGNQQHIID